MAAKFKLPGVYIENSSNFPPVVAQVESAIPAFIGYTELADENGESQVLKFRPKKISSLREYEIYFGKAPNEKNIKAVIEDKMDNSATPNLLSRNISVSIGTTQPCLMHYAMRLYFDNGGGPCYVTSVGDYSGATIDLTDLTKGLDEIKAIDEPTLIVFPDGINMNSAENYYTLMNRALRQCKQLGDRFTIIDVHGDDSASLRASNTLGNDSLLLKYGAAYYPFLKTIYSITFNDNDIAIKHSTMDLNGTTGRGNFDTKPLNHLSDSTNTATYDLDLYNQIKLEINKNTLTLGPGSAIAGVYVAVDNNRGVWKAPANVSINSCLKPTVDISNEDQEDLNVHTSGKSINAIRVFPSRGILVWGARTLAGNDNEWRYISVRRLFNMVEESVIKSAQRFVFEPNNANTWNMARTMIENYLSLLWREGALKGQKHEQAYFVRIGLGETMTTNDLQNGIMNVEIGMAPLRPAEFIIIKFSIKMEEVQSLISNTSVKTNLYSFPSAQLVKTELKWNDLVLNEKTLDQVKEIEVWLNNSESSIRDWNIKSNSKLGNMVLFSGPSGTGKTLTANLLGKYTQHDVYRIDLSLVLSKYIGETEKNLSHIFDKAAGKNWILFFDEADALFGKRSNIQDSHDRYANQEVSYLLQRIESYPGLVILSSNLKSNIDTAFISRFNSVLEFELPTFKQRLALWQNNFSKNIALQKTITLEKLAEKYPVTGANIVNVVRYSSLKAMTNKNKTIQKSDILEGIKKEYQKQKKNLNL